MKIMVIAPHPDDDIIGCGGSIAKHIKLGHDVSIVYMTSGEAGSVDLAQEKLAVVRETEAARAAQVLGVKDISFLKIPDGYIEFKSNYLVMLIKIIRSINPEIVYFPHQNDQVQDHRITHQLVREACNRAGGPWFRDCGYYPWVVSTLLAYEIWTPLGETVSYTEDISDFMHLKIAALKEHKSQLKDIRYDDAVTGLNRYRGIMTGKCQYAECFQIIKAGGFSW